MLVNLLIVDHWVGISNDLQYAYAATWDVIEAAIRRLDGREHTEVSIEKIEEDSDENEGEISLSVGGGPGWFLVIFRSKDGSEFVPDTGNHGGGTCELVIGGQGVDFPKNMTMHLESALKVARDFAVQSAPVVPAGWVICRG